MRRPFIWLYNFKLMFLSTRLLLIPLAMIFLTSCVDIQQPKTPSIPRISVLVDKVALPDNKTIDYGNQRSASLPKLITIQNVDTKDVEMRLILPRSADFVRDNITEDSVVACGNTTITLKPDESCNIYYKFIPQDYGDRTVTLHALVADRDMTLLIMKGFGLNSGELVLSISALDFGDTTKMNTLKQRALTLINNKPKIAKKVKYTFSDPVGFKLDNSSSCSKRQTLQFGDSCKLIYNMDLATSGQKQAVVAIKTDNCGDLDNCSISDNFTLIGNVTDNANTLQDNTKPTLKQHKSITAVAGTLYLLANDGTSTEFWKFDTTISKWKKFKDSIVQNIPANLPIRIFNFKGKILVVTDTTATNPNNRTFIIDNLATPLNITAREITISPLPNLRYYASAVKSDNTAIYIFGGTNSAGTSQFNTLYKFDDEALGWQLIPPPATTPPPILPEVRSHAGMAYHNNMLYLYGGKGASGATIAKGWRYDINTNTWEEIRSTGHPLFISEYMSMAVIDTNKLTVFDGKNGKIYTTNLPPVPPAVPPGVSTSTWTVSTNTTTIFYHEDMNMALVGNVAYLYSQDHNITNGNSDRLKTLVNTTLNNVALKDIVPFDLKYHASIIHSYKADGTEIFAYTYVPSDNQSFLKYDYIKGTYQKLPYSVFSSPEGIPPRDNATLTNVNGNFYLYGGELTRENNKITNALFILQPIPYQIKTVSNPGLPFITQHTTASYKKELFIFGGIDDQQKVLDNFISIQFSDNGTEILPGYGDVQTTSDRPTARSLSSMAVVNDKIYIFGGRGQDGKAMSDLWEFDPDKNKRTFTKIVDIPITISRHSHSLVAMNGNLLIIGGIDEDGKENGEIIEIDLKDKKQKTITPTDTGDVPQFKGRTYFVNIDDKLYGTYNGTTSLYLY